MASSFDIMRHGRGADLQLELQARNRQEYLELVRFPFKRAFDEAVGPTSDYCLACGGPSREGPIVILLQGDEELSQCPECEGPVGPSGRTVGRLCNGKVILKVIRMGDD